MTADDISDKLWKPKKLRHHIRSISSGVSVNSYDAPPTGNEAAVLKTSCVYSGEFEPREAKVVASDEVDRVACPVLADRLIVSRMNTPPLVGSAGYSAVHIPNLYLPDRLWQIELKGLNPRFVHRWTQTSLYRDQVAAVSAGTSSSMHNLAQEDFRSFELVAPSLELQAEVADYLDAQTAKIDTLIGKQERLIETLAERRQAVISHAVTKGLDPAVPIKDSGVEWLGRVPDHWHVTQVKRAFYVTLGKMLDAARAERLGNQPLPYIRAANIQEHGLDLADVNTMPFTPAEKLSLSLKASDLLVVEGGAVGVCVLLTEDMPDWSFQKTVNRVRTRGKHSTAFLRYFLDAIRLGGVIDMFCNKSTIAHFTAEKLNATELPLPPLPEQQAIVAHLDRETSQIDALSAKARQMIDILKERRQALISAAVTGKIDVRGLTA